MFVSKPIFVENVRLLICDMDGTLYPGLDQSRLGSLFLARLSKTLDPDRQAVLVQALRSILPVIRELQKQNSPIFGNLNTGELFSPGATGNHDMSRMSLLEDPSVIIKLACSAAGIDGTFADRVHHEAKMGLLRATGIIQPGINDAIYDLIQSFRGVPKVIATNSPLANAESVLKLLGVAEAFSRIYASCKKPFGLIDVLDGTLRHRHLEPSDALYVGDSYGIEIEVARSLGIPSIYISQHPSLRELVMLSEADAENAAPLVAAPNLNAVAGYLKL